VWQSLSARTSDACRRSAARPRNLALCGAFAKVVVSHAAALCRPHKLPPGSRRTFCNNCQQK